MPIQNNFVKEIDTKKGIEFGIYSLGDLMANPHNNESLSEKQRLNEFIEIAKMAEQAGIDVFDLGESHQDYFVSQAQSIVTYGLLLSSQ